MALHLNSLERGLGVSEGAIRERAWRRKRSETPKESRNCNGGEVMATMAGRIRGEGWSWRPLTGKCWKVGHEASFREKRGQKVGVCGSGGKREEDDNDF